MIGALGEGMLTIADGPEMPSINDFLPDPFVFQGTPFAINRIILVRILATVIMMLVLGITASRAKLIPGRWQGAVEWLIEFVRDNIVYQVMGELRGKRYVPMITTVFCTLLICAASFRASISRQARPSRCRWCLPCGASASTGLPASVKRALATS